MMDILKGILVVLLLVAVIALGIMGVAIAAIVGLVVQAAMIGAPFILAVILAVRDWWIIRQLKKSQHKKV